MSQSMYYGPGIQVSVADQYYPSGQTTPDPNIVGGVRIQPQTQSPPPSGGSSQPPVIEVVAKADGTLEVLGHVSATVAQQQLDAAVAAATPPADKVLPEGYTQNTSRATDGAITKVRLAVPGGRWVEFDPVANTFLVG